jgi:hypothetical protein
MSGWILLDICGRIEHRAGHPAQARDAQYRDAQYEAVLETTAWTNWVPGPDSSAKGLGSQGCRSGRNAARSCAANSSGSSQAAKWPPRSASPK